MPILTRDDGTAYPFDMEGLSQDDKIRAAHQFDSVLAGGGDYSQAVTTAEGYVAYCRNPNNATVNATKEPEEPEEETEEEPTTNPRTPMNRTALLAAVGITGAILAASWAWRHFVPDAPLPVNPLVEIAQVRASAALELQAANEAEKDAAARQRVAKARYDAAWKKEACLIAGNCPKK